MKEHPILFNGDMVRAILDGRKTQTRRLITRLNGFGQIREFQRSETPGYDWTFRCKRWLWQDFRHDDAIARNPYGLPGDRLWVRETWQHNPYGGIVYRATSGVVDCDGRGWRPSIHMPRWASRITLEVIGARVQRVQDISEGDAIAEGATCWVCGDMVDGSSENDCACFHTKRNAIPSFEILWNSINAKSGHGWDANPWVWVYDFKRVENA